MDGHQPEFTSHHQILTHPDEPIMYFQKNQREESEINLNVVKFLRTNYEMVNEIYQPVQAVRAHLLQFMCCQTDYMVVQGGTPVLGHLPLLEDLVGCYNEGACVMLYWLLQRFYSSSAPLTIPPEIAEAIDLKPNLNTDSVVVYSFPMLWRHIFVGSFTDTLHIMTIDTTNNHLRFQVEGCTSTPRVKRCLPIRKRYNRVSYRGEHLVCTGEYAVVDRGSVVLIWNARGCTRPSFGEHFGALHQKFNPLLLIILEARIGKYYANNWLLRNLPGEYELEICGPHCRPGGVLMFWKPNMLRVNFLHRSCLPNGMVVDAVFQAPPTPGRPPSRPSHQVELNNDPCSSDEEAEQGSLYWNSGLAFDGSNHHWGIGKDL